jgi:hypothetical protein
MKAILAQNQRFIFMLICVILGAYEGFGQKKFMITEDAPKIITPDYFGTAKPQGGDTIYISSNRIKGIKFNKFSGNELNPLVFINYQGQVNINDPLNWGALTFENCKFIKVTGTGTPSFKYGFKLAAQTCGLAFSELSTDCEAEYIAIDHSGFFGICAKKDFGGNPPIPAPIFNNLIIHDTYITNVTEGMYLGETKSPGMEFRHVRVFNNLITNTGREGIQVANMVEDVEVYNNIIINSGLDQEASQQNNFQIGDNTVGKYYNNIFIGAPGFGLINMGSGNIEIFNNYFEDNLGVFIDNRQFTTAYAPIEVSQNYFFDINYTSMIRNMNEINPLQILNNQFDGSCPFILSSTTKQSNLTSINNLLTNLSKIKFLETTTYSLSSNPSQYNSLGTVAGSGISMNEWPVLNLIEDQILKAEETRTLLLTATVNDNDALLFSLDTIPSFITMTNTGNGSIQLKLNPTAQHVGLHKILVTVSDASHQAKDRKMLSVLVSSISNRAPEILPVDALEAYNLTETIIPIKVKDADFDKITLTSSDLPEFIRIETKSDSLFHLHIKPKYLDRGVYSFNLKYTDNLSAENYYRIELNVKPTQLIPETPVYRLNCGGPEQIAQSLNWESVYKSGSGKKYVVTHSYETGSHSYKGINNTSAPANIFGPYSFDYTGGSELKWAFPLPNGKYKVNLFFRERKADIEFDGSKAIFNVLLETKKILTNFCIYDENGEDPLQRTFETVVKDKALNIDFEQIAGKPKISGIEIIFLEDGNDAPSITKVSDVMASEGDTLRVPLNVLDDGFSPFNSLVFSAKNFPSFVKLMGENNNTSILISPDYIDAGNYSNLWVKVSDGDLSDSISFNLIVNDKTKPNFPYFSMVNSITIPEGSTENLKILVADPEGDSISLSFNSDDLNSVILNQATQTLIFNPDYYSSGTYKLTITATDNKNNSTIDTIQVTIINVNPRIILSPDMIIDEVVGRSVDSPKYLVDEQNLSVEKKEHPISKSWKPFYTSIKAPYHVTIDLGAEYDLTRICFHDMNASEALIISTGQPGNWIPLYTEMLNTYINWKIKDVSVRTRYVRLTMQAGSSAYTNEIALYGQLVQDIGPDGGLKSAEISTSKNKLNERIKKDEIIIYPTLITKTINLNIQNQESEEYRVFLFNSKGQQLFSDHFYHNEITEKSYPIGNLNLNSGQYFMKVQNQKGKFQTFKLIKT